MRQWHRRALAFVTIIALSDVAAAEQPAPPGGAPPDQTAASSTPSSADPATEVTAAAPAKEDEPKRPKRGDFDAGGQVRLPSGPDEMGQFATFNWIAVDLRARYYLLDSITVTGNIPLAVKKPDALMAGGDPRLVGGISAIFDARLPKMPFQKEGTESGLILTGAYMREGAMLLSEKDFPLFIGDFKPGYTAGLFAKVKLGEVVDFVTTPVFVFQSGTVENLTAIQIPTSTILKLGSLIKLAADLGIFTGDDFSFRGSNGGRIAAGASLDVKMGPIITHAGIGFASLLTGGLYPTIGDSVYVDLNVKFAK
jgi:hypothetical protein